MNLLLKNKFYIPIFFMIFLLCGCGGEDKEGFIFVAERADHRIYAPGKGELVPVNERDVNVAYGLHSTISELAPEGKSVKAGEVIARLDTRRYTESNRWARQQLESDELDLKEKEKENELKIITDSEELRLSEITLEYQKKKEKHVLSGADEYSLENSRLSLEKSEISHKYQKAALSEKERLYKEDFISRLEYERYLNSIRISELSIQKEKNLYEIQQEKPTTTEVRIAELERIKSEISHNKLLKEIKTSKLSSELFFKNKRLSIQRSKAQYETVNSYIEKSTIKAPISGVLIYGSNWQGKTRVGKRVWSGMNILKVSDTSSLKVKGVVAEKNIESIKKGDSAEVFLNAFPDDVVYGKVTEIGKLGRLENEQDPKGRKIFDIHITLDEQKKEFRPGLTVDFRIITERLEDCIKIPALCVKQKNGEFSVKSAGAISDRKLILKPVFFNNDYYFFREGIDEGTRLYIDTYL